MVRKQVVHVGEIIKGLMTPVNMPVQLIMYEEGVWGHDRSSKESINASRYFERWRERETDIMSRPL